MKKLDIDQFDKVGLLNKIFSAPSFQNLDQQQLINQYDNSTQLLAANQTDSNPIPLTTPTFSHIPDEGWLINSPGHYTMMIDCNWNPTQVGAAINIQSDQVTLDLNGNTITINPPANSGNAKYNGIQISSSNGVTVQNGTISGPTFSGIQATESLNVTLNVMTISNIKITDKTDQYFTPSGIFMGLCANISINNCLVSEMDVLTSSCAGIQLVLCWGNNVTSTTVSNILNRDGGAQGFSYLLCFELITDNCSCMGIQTQNLNETVTDGHTCIGFLPIFCAGLQYLNCSVSKITGCCDDAHGMSLFFVAYSSVTGFTANGVMDGPSPYFTGAKATGLEVYGYYVNLLLCNVTDIKAIVPQDLQSAGFACVGDIISINQCTATNVQVLNRELNPDTSLGYGTGYGWAPDPRKSLGALLANNVNYTQCTSVNCQVGFDTWNHTQSSWTLFTATNCGQFNLNEPKGATRTLSMNKCSEQPPGVPATSVVTNQAENNNVPTS